MYQERTIILSIIDVNKITPGYPPSLLIQIIFQNEFHATVNTIFLSYIYTSGTVRIFCQSEQHEDNSTIDAASVALHTTISNKFYQEENLVFQAALLILHKSARYKCPPSPFWDSSRIGGHACYQPVLVAGCWKDFSRYSNILFIHYTMKSKNY